MTRTGRNLTNGVLGLLAFAVALAFQPIARAQSSLEAKINQITTRPEFRHSSFGIEVYSLDQNKVIYALNSQQFFTPASTTKLFTEGTALELLGADYRFHTKVYRTGSINSDGTLNGDLILVASGDPDLSGRIQPDGTLAFENEDHAYDGSPDTKAVPGDPLLVIRQLARQVASRGIKRIIGRVLVDATLFPEGDRELGTDLVISPICVNDNIIDLTVSAGDTQGAPVKINISPFTSYVTFDNQITTGPAGSKPDVNVGATDTVNADGSHYVTLTGTFPLGGPSILYKYAVPQPSRFAQVTFIEALRQYGVAANIPDLNAPADFKSLSAFYTAENIVAEHVSPPLSEEVKVTLKVSQNLHASMTPYILGAVLGHATKDVNQAGFNLEHDFLAKAGLDLSGASQADGAGGAQSAFFTPDFVAHYLAFMSRQKDFSLFEKALPILGRDGTLWKIEVNSPAAGHVMAKTGTFGAYDALNKDLMLTGKGLAGYMITADGRHLAFALYANRVLLSLNEPNAADTVVGEALGQIASAIYSTPPH
jgi:PBP4 family serine-type D-alanyl-D-alanine carboxypeptidase